MVAATSAASFATVPTKTLQEKVLGIIEAAGSFGCISDEILPFFPAGTKTGTVNGRYSELERKGLIYVAGDTRAGASGKQQTVWRHAKFAPLHSPHLKKPPAGDYSPFERAIIYAARLLAKSATLEDAKAEMTKEILKIKARHTT